MSNLLVACETLRDEINKVQESVGFHGEIIWMNTSLHNDPNLLRTELQKVIDNNIGYDHILMAYGSCGNSAVGLEATHSNLVIPNTADCISMLLCKNDKVDSLRKGTFFLTKGWINGEKSLLVEYNYCIERYGEKRAERIFGAMLKHYNNLMLIDTESYDLQEYETISREFATKVKLNFMLEKGNLSILEKLLSGVWDENFSIIVRGETILLEHFPLVSSY